MGQEQMHSGTKSSHIVEDGQELVLPDLPKSKEVAINGTSIFSSLKLPRLDSIGFGKVKELGAELYEKARKTFNLDGLDEKFKSAYENCKEFIASFLSTNPTSEKAPTRESFDRFRDNLTWMKVEVEKHREKFSEEFLELIKSCEKLEELIDKDKETLKKSGDIVSSRLSENVAKVESELQSSAMEKAEKHGRHIRECKEGLCKLHQDFSSDNVSTEKLREELKSIKETLVETTKEENENISSYKTELKKAILEISGSHNIEEVNNVIRELELGWQGRDIYYEAVSLALEKQLYETECAFEAYSNRYTAYLSLVWTPGLSGNAFFNTPYSEVAFLSEVKDLFSNALSAVEKINEKNSDSKVPTLRENTPEMLKPEPIFDKDPSERVFDKNLTKKEEQEIEEKIKELERKFKEKVYKDINGDISVVDNLNYIKSPNLV